MHKFLFLIFFKIKFFWVGKSGEAKALPAWSGIVLLY